MLLPDHTARSLLAGCSLAPLAYTAP